VQSAAARVRLDVEDRVHGVAVDQSNAIDADDAHQSTVTREREQPLLEPKFDLVRRGHERWLRTVRGGGAPIRIP
jgi:hypothetical protein